MANDPEPKTQNRKRRLRETDVSQDHPLPEELKSIRGHHSTSRIPSPKKAKSIGEHSTLNAFPPPEFWDSLSKVWLTRRALRELDRRNPSAPLVPIPTPLGQISKSKALQRFARRGGPSLGDLCGYPEPTMSSKRSSLSNCSSENKRSKRTHPPNSSSTENYAESRRRTSAYDACFEQHLADNGVYMNNRKSKPGGLDQIYQILAQPRPSLSLSRFSESAFENFRQINEDAIDEGEVMRKVLPIIYGDANIPSHQNLLFTRLESITDNATVRPKPDLYDGARLEDIDKHVIEDIDKHLPKDPDKYPEEQNSFVIPTKHRIAPVAPNFFLEAKAPKGGGDVAKLQACLDGALGARAMHALQSYGAGYPVYDNNAYTLASTYQYGVLSMYAIHVSPTGFRGAPEYHMTHVDSWAMHGNPNTYRQGVTAVRNGRDWAMEKRHQLISAANGRARSLYSELSTLRLSNSGASKTTISCPNEESYPVDEIATSMLSSAAEKPKPLKDELAALSSHPIVAHFSFSNAKPRPLKDEFATSTYDLSAASFSRPVQKSYSSNFADIVEESETLADDVIVSTDEPPGRKHPSKDRRRMLQRNVRPLE